jgi:hypothetical protein
MLFMDRENTIALLIDTAGSLTHNLAKTEVEKITKYENCPGNQKLPEA